MVNPQRKKKPAQHNAGRERRLSDIDNPRPTNSDRRLNDGRMTSSNSQPSCTQDDCSGTATGAEEPNRTERGTTTNGGERRADDRLNWTVRRNGGT